MNDTSVTAARASRTLVLVLVGLFVLVGAVDAQTKRTYTVRAGDTLYRIALNHNMRVEQLQALNGLEGTVIKVGQVLRLTDGSEEEPSDSLVVSIVPPNPVAAEPDTISVDPPRDAEEDSLETDPPVAAPSPVSLPEAAPTTVVAVMDSSGTVSHGNYAASPGQSLLDIAFSLGVSVDTLRTMNPSHPVVLADGPPVRVPARFASTTYRVKAGDTLFRIAADHGVSFAELRSANPAVGEVIRIGQVLRIPSGARPARPVMPLAIAEGAASVYPARFAGRLMASGRAYDASRFTLAHPALPFGTVVLVENAETGRSTFAEVADRMPVSTDFVVEVSRAVAEAIGLENSDVRVRIIHANQ